MTGFWALARKELLEQRRSWRFMALAGVFITLALLTTIIPFIVDLFQDWDRGTLVMPATCFWLSDSLR